ncbi:MAG: hypothetical protein IJ877_07430 [Candidatus Gastranaerophilales bacterium]|nr:hypothetical protein [Candidatus Gastranaerophilales bacterium]
MLKSSVQSNEGKSTSKGLIGSLLDKIKTTVSEGVSIFSSSKGTDRNYGNDTFSTSTTNTTTKTNKSTKTNDRNVGNDTNDSSSTTPAKSGTSGSIFNIIRNNGKSSKDGTTEKQDNSSKSGSLVDRVKEKTTEVVKSTTEYSAKSTTKINYDTTKLTASTNNANLFSTYYNNGTKTGQTYQASYNNSRFNISAQEVSSMIYQETLNYENASMAAMDSMYNSFNTELKNGGVVDSTYAEKANYSGLNIIDLESSKLKMEGDIETNIASMQAVYEGNHPAIEEAHDNYLSAQESYRQALNTSSDPQICAMRSQIDMIDTCKTQLEGRISSNGVRISQTTSQISRQDRTIESLSSDISNYDTQIQVLQNMIASCDSATASALENQIRNLQELKGCAEARKSNAELTKNCLQTRLSVLNEQKDNDTKALRSYKSQQSELENQIDAIGNANIRAAHVNLVASENALDTLTSQVLSEIESSNGILEHELSIVNSKICDFKRNMAAKASTYGVDSITENSLAASTQERAIAESEANNIVEAGVLKDSYSQTAQGLQSARESRLDIYNGNNNEVQGYKLAAEGSFNNLYADLLKSDPELGELMADTKGKLEDREGKIDEINIQISKYEDGLLDMKCELGGIECSIASLKEAQETLESIDVSVLDSHRMQMYNKQKAMVETELNLLTERKDTLEMQVYSREQGAEYQAYCAMKDQRQIFQHEYATYYDELQAQTIQASENPDAKESSDAFKSSLTDYHDTKQQAVDDANSAVVTAQGQTNEIYRSYTLQQVKEDQEKYRFGELTDRDILAFAQIYSAQWDISAKADASSNSWGDSYINHLEEALEHDEYMEWSKNIVGGWYASNIYEAAVEAGAIVQTQNAQPGDLVLHNQDENGMDRPAGIFLSMDEDGTIHVLEPDEDNNMQQKTYKANDGQIKAICRMV